MPDYLDVKNELLDKVVAQIEANLHDEQFGVAELAELMSMSRSSLLRKVQKLTGESVSVLIRNVRLHHAQTYLLTDELTVSEIAYKVGFNSNSYFIKCYKDRYGHPPGEERKQFTEPKSLMSSDPIRHHQKLMLMGSLVLLLILLSFLWSTGSQELKLPDKSIAVLPFINDSQDSSNVYIINGMMESVLNNLQKIEDLRVVSRTSVEPYRKLTRTLPQIAEELDVYYVLEGSGQKIGNQILLTVQLIAGERDNHLWSKQYQRMTEDIFDLQAEVAADIAAEIKVIITPDENRRINTPLTNDAIAYDHYLQGVEFTKQETFAGLDSAINEFKKAISEDSDFAAAHAYIAICYYYLDIFKREKQHSEVINTYADRAILLDPESGICLISKGLYYMHEAQYERATTYFEKTLQYNPNSAQANNLLSMIYNSFLPDTEKYLQYALKGTKLERTGTDSVATGFIYLHLANAFIQNGFVEEAEKSARLSLQFDTNNLYSAYVLAYVLLAKDRDIERTRDMLLGTYKKDTTRLDVIQEVAKIYYVLGEYDSAHLFYDKFLKTRDLYGMSVFETEEIKIAYVMKQLGELEEAQAYLSSYKKFADSDQSKYKDLYLFSYYAVLEDQDKAMSHLEKFSHQSDFQYWFVLFLEDDPISRLVRSHPGYEEASTRIYNQFWASHERLKQQLKRERLL